VSIGTGNLLSVMFRLRDCGSNPCLSKFAFFSLWLIVSMLGRMMMKSNSVLGLIRRSSGSLRVEREVNTLTGGHTSSSGRAV